jgi:hypothetical protein
MPSHAKHAVGGLVALVVGGVDVGVDGLVSS